MKMFKKILIMALTIYTIVFLSMLVYANTATDQPPGIIYSADRLSTEPPQWYLPQDLGITQVLDYHENATLIHVVVENETIPLDVELPCFKYNGNYYKISQYSQDTATIGPLETIRRILPIMSLPLLAWIMPLGFLVYKRRKSNEESISR